MSSFLRNVARRGAGLPVASPRPAPPVPVGPEPPAAEGGPFAPTADATEASAEGPERPRPELPGVIPGERRGRLPAERVVVPRTVRGIAPSLVLPSFTAPVEPAAAPVGESANSDPPPWMPLAGREPAKPPLPPKVVLETDGAAGDAAPTDAVPVFDPGRSGSDRRRATEAAEDLGKGAPPIRPAPAALTTSLRLAAVVPASPAAPVTPLPIHVRIGRVEVHGAPPPSPSFPAGPPPGRGFAAYARLRTYRLWPR